MNLHTKILHHSKKILQKAKQKISESRKREEHNKSLEFALPKFLDNEEKLEKIITEISIISAIKIIAIIVGVVVLALFFERTASIILSFFLALFFSAALFPGVEFLETKKVPRAIAIIILLLCVVGALVFLISNLLPALIEQFIALGEWIRLGLQKISNGNFSALPDSLQKYGSTLQEYLRGVDEWVKNLETDSEAQKGLIQVIGDTFKPWKDGISSLIGGIINFLIQFLLILILSFFILFDRESLRAFFLSFFSPKTKKYAAKKSEQMQVKIAQWIHGQMILFMFMGGVTWIVLTLLGVDYALTLGFLTGLAEFIPYIGPSLAFIISTPIAFGSGTETGVLVMIFFFLLQLFEGNILVPMVMKKAVGIPPIVTILSMLVGFELLGAVGAVLAVPVASILGIFIFDIQKKEEEIFQKAADTPEISKKKTEK